MGHSVQATNRQHVVTADSRHAGADVRPRGLRLLEGRRTLVDALVVSLLLAIVPLVAGDFHLRLLASYLALAIMAVGLDLIWGYAGVLSMGQAAYFGTSAYITALGVERWGWTPAVAVAAGVAAAVALAAITSAFVFYSRVGAFFVAIITLALAVLAEQIVGQFSTVTGGFNGVVVATFSGIGSLTLYALSAGVAAAMLLAAAVLATSDFGRLLVAVRDDEQRVRFLGFGTPAVKTLVFCIGGLFAGVGGTLFTIDTQFVSPGSVGFVLSTQVVIWTVIGGRQSIVGPFLGAVGLSFLGQSLGGALLDYWQLVLGLLLIVMVMFAPDGIYPSLRRRGARGRTESLRVRSTDGRSRPAATSSLRVAGVTKQFGDFTAVQDVTLALNAGEILCLVGPNGAGKSTLINCITGEARPDSGEVALEDEQLSGASPEAIARRGVGRTFQTTRVFDTLSVFENLLLSAAAGSIDVPDLFRRSRDVEVPEHVASFVQTSGLAQRLNDLPPALSHGERQWLELCMAMATGARILLLDEPTAGLTRAERSVVGSTLRDLADQTGLGLLLVEHDLEFVSGLASAVLVLHQGEAIAFGGMEEIAANSIVRDVYLGAAK